MTQPEYPDELNAVPCGSGLAREDVSTVNTTGDCPSAIASKLAPTMGPG